MLSEYYELNRGDHQCPFFLRGCHPMFGAASFIIILMELIVEFIVASATSSTSQTTEQQPSLSAVLQCLQSTSRGGFCVLTLFILALIKMW